jgi:hypothetical protein
MAKNANSPPAPQEQNPPAPAAPEAAAPAAAQQPSPQQPRHKAREYAAVAARKNFLAAARKTMGENLAFLLDGLSPGHGPALADKFLRALDEYLAARVKDLLEEELG